MKRITAIIMAFVMLLSFAGCGDKKVTKEKSENKPVKTVTVPYKSDYPYLYMGEKDYDYGYVDYVTNDNSAYTNERIITSPVKAICQNDDGLIYDMYSGRVETLLDNGTISGKDLSNVVQITSCIDYSVNYHFFAVKSDGTVYMECEEIEKSNFYHVSEWTDIVAISVSRSHIVGLKSDGTVVATGSNGDKQCDVEDWKNIVAVYAVYQNDDTSYTFGIKADGTIIHTTPDLEGAATWCGGYRSSGSLEVDYWTDIISLSVTDNFAMGLKSDGTVVTCGSAIYDETKLSNWTDIAAIKAYKGLSIGIKKDGTVVSAGDNYIIRTYLKDKKLKLD